MDVNSTMSNKSNVKSMWGKIVGVRLPAEHILILYMRWNGLDIHRWAQKFPKYVFYLIKAEDEDEFVS